MRKRQPKDSPSSDEVDECESTAEAARISTTSGGLKNCDAEPAPLANCNTGSALPNDAMLEGIVKTLFTLEEPERKPFLMQTLSAFQGPERQSVLMQIKERLDVQLWEEKYLMQTRLGVLLGKKLTPTQLVKSDTTAKAAPAPTAHSGKYMHRRILSPLLSTSLSTSLSTPPLQRKRMTKTQ